MDRTDGTVVDMVVAIVARRVLSTASRRSANTVAERVDHVVSESFAKTIVDKIGDTVARSITTIPEESGQELEPNMLKKSRSFYRGFF